MTTVLVVDDNSVDRLLAARWVEEEGWAATLAENGAEAIKSIEQAAPDVVLTDLQMPELDGLELVREIKTRYPLIPVVLMTAHGSEEFAVAALKTGAASYVSKKNLKTGLGQTLQLVLDMANARRNRQQVFDSMTKTESHFVLGHKPEAIEPLISYIQDALRLMELCDETDLLRTGTAVTEALHNAIEHGNLEMAAALRDAGDRTYDGVLKDRIQQAPYADRRVYVRVTISRSEAVIVVRDEGPGFDFSVLPDPTDFTDFEHIAGKGLLLMRLFMDSVRFNDSGNEVSLVIARQEDDD